MQTRRIGPFKVSAIGLGCMNISAGYGPADDEESARLLQQTLDSGCNFFDTASLYGAGHSETLIGNTLADRRSEYVLASKCGIYTDENGRTALNGRPEVLKKTCEESLRRLQTGHIDLYYLHRTDPRVPVEESVGALADLVREGKIGAIGLSEVCADTLRRAHREHPIAALQSEYSLWSRTPERGVLATCQELETTFVPFSPLARGFLAGSASDVTRLSANDLRATIARPRFEPENFARNCKLLTPYNDIAASLNCTPAQLALSWLLATHDQTLVPIPGTRSIEHMQENMGACQIRLSEPQIEELNQLINDSVVAGSRYTPALMKAVDSERD